MTDREWFRVSFRLATNDPNIPPREALEFFEWLRSGEYWIDDVTVRKISGTESQIPYWIAPQ